MNPYPGSNPAPATNEKVVLTCAFAGYRLRVGDVSLALWRVLEVEHFLFARVVGRVLQRRSLGPPPSVLGDSRASPTRRPCQRLGNKWPVVLATLGAIEGNVWDPFTATDIRTDT